jgi:hypothetical protein
LNKSTFIHPILFALASIIYTYLFSSIIASPSQAMRSFFIFLGILAILIFPLRWLLNDWDLVTIFLSVIAVTFFSPQVFFQAEISLIGLLIFFVFAYLYIKKQSFKTLHVINTLNLSSIVLVILMGGNTYIQFSGLPLFDIPQYNWKNRILPAELVVEGTPPDIYYIILDGYGREDILNEYYQYDNSSFIVRIRAKGFIVPESALSNYPKTVMSISSTLNMNYISELTPQLQGNETRFWWLLEPTIDYSDVRLMLEGAGYYSYTITTGWGPTDNSSTNIYYQPHPIIINDFETVILTATPMRFSAPYLSKISYLPSFDAHRNLFLYNFSSLSAISKANGPKFVVAHIVSPHPPFVFDEHGNPLNPNYRYSFNDASDVALTDEEYRNGYIKQLEFLNKNLETLIDEILLNSKTPPIIILQADHGPGMLTDFSTSKNTCLRERFSVFAAYYLPKADPSIIPDDITPVNIFRIVFNEYFGTQFVLLPNSHYYIKGLVQIFNTEDITSVINTCSVHQ